MYLVQKIPWVPVGYEWVLSTHMGVVNWRNHMENFCGDNNLNGSAISSAANFDRPLRRILVTFHVRIILLEAETKSIPNCNFVLSFTRLSFATPAVRSQIGRLVCYSHISIQ